MEGIGCANDVMVIQTSQLGQIKNLEDQVWILMNKVTEQDHIITNLVRDNLEHLQDNMRLTRVGTGTMWALVCLSQGI